MSIGTSIEIVSLALALLVILIAYDRGCRRAYDAGVKDGSKGIVPLCRDSYDDGFRAGYEQALVDSGESLERVGLLLQEAIVKHG